ncbi:matrilin-3-like [Gigantopelta aegis]|uniref:matrilin-3-like n=1 Tax=Gigantopelta aegis TaxID=1735272 RepID=UPI001B88BC68|nr:matrilin-3-like [Gigantopelta aegis]
MKVFLLIFAALFGSTRSQAQCGAACQATKGICVDDGQGSMYCSCSAGFSQAPGDPTSCVASSILVTSGCRFMGCGAHADCKENKLTGKYECMCQAGFEKNPNKNSECIRSKASAPKFNGCRYIGCGDPQFGRCIFTTTGTYQCQCYTNAQLDFFTQKCVEKPYDMFSGNSFWPYMFMGDWLW